LLGQPYGRRWRENPAWSPGYLDEHLRRVRERHDRHGQIAIRAIGVGLDLSPFYPHNLPINLTDSPDNQTLDDIAALITH